MAAVLTRLSDIAIGLKVHYIFVQYISHCSHNIVHGYIKYVHHYFKNLQCPPDSGGTVQNDVCTFHSHHTRTEKLNIQINKLVDSVNIWL